MVTYCQSLNLILSWKTSVKYQDDQIYLDVSCVNTQIFQFLENKDIDSIMHFTDMDDIFILSDCHNSLMS